jgi:predicted phage terminase large subunit-like protein
VNAELTEAVVARSSPLALAVVDSATQHGTAFHVADHLLPLDRALTDLCLGHSEKRRLAVVMPPRFGKSSVVSKYLPAFHLSNFPSKLVTVACNEASLASSFTRQTRAVIEDRGELLGLEIDPRLRGGSEFNVRRAGSQDRFEGGLRAVGVGGSLTGRGSSLLIIDDPIRDAASAHSATKREAVWQWYQSTASTRLEPGGAIVLVMTRWHLDDLFSRVLDAEPDRWDVLHVPALDATGESAWPERWPTAVLEARRAEVGSYWWNALYAGSPVPVEEGGQIFNVAKIKRAASLKEVAAKAPPQKPLMPAWQSGPARILRTCVGTDLAFTEGTKADYSAVVHAMLTTDGQVVIAHVGRAKVGRSIEWAAGEIAAHTPTNVTVVADLLGGRPTKAHFRREWREQLKGHTFNVKDDKVQGTKTERAQAFAAAIERGDVWLLEGPWNDAYLAELQAFPHGANDDQVDASSTAVNYLGGGGVWNL